MPYMAEISQRVVTRLVTEPNLTVAEPCQYLSMEPTEFLDLTLSHTLPVLATTSASDVLEIISVQLKKNCSYPSDG